MSDNGLVHLLYKVTNFLGDCTHRTTAMTAEKADEAEAFIRRRHGDGLVWIKREPEIVLKHETLEIVINAEVEQPATT